MPGGGVDISGSTGPAHRVGGRYIRDEVRLPAGVAKGINMVKGPRCTMVGETGKFDETIFLRGAPPSGAYMDDDGTVTKTGVGVKRYRVSGSYLEYM